VSAVEEQTQINGVAITEAADPAYSLPMVRQKQLLDHNYHYGEEENKEQAKCKKQELL